MSLTLEQETDLTLAAVCAFIDNPPADETERERQRFNLTTQVERLRNRSAAESR